MKCWAVITAAVCLFPALTSEQASACVTDCGDAISCWLDAGACLVEAGRAREAVELLKPVVARHPDRPALARALARAYRAEGNPSWALRTLQTALDTDPTDCESAGWVAWVQLSEGYADLAEQALDRPGCPRTPADRTRFALLRARIANLRAEPDDARAALAVALDQPGAYPEDLPLLDQLRADSFPALLSPLVARLDLALGYTTNAFAGSPVDPGEAGPPSSLVRWDVAAELRLPAGAHLAPFLELGARGLWIDDPQARELSYLEPGARAGLLLAPGLGHLALAYRVEALLLDQIGAPFYTAQRAELDWELDSVTLLAGAGRTAFQDADRTRFEADLGAGWAGAPTSWLRLVLTGQGRWHAASSRAWSLVGASLVGLARVDMGPRLRGRATVGLATDHYYASDGRAGFEAYQIRAARTDLLTRAGAGLWIPVVGDGQFGLDYTFARRWSTADRPGSDFGYQEHRIELHLRWVLDADRIRRSTQTEPDHVPLDHGLQADPGDERLRDLLRQEESDRRGACGCGG